MVNTEYCSYVDSMNKIGAIGADYLKHLYESRHLIRTVTAAYFETPYFLKAPILREC